MDSLTCEILRWHAIELAELASESFSHAEVAATAERKFADAMEEMGQQ